MSRHLLQSSHVTADSESGIQTFGRDETGGGGGDELFMMS